VKTEENQECPTCGEEGRRLFIIVESSDREVEEMSKYGICAECMYELIEKHFSLIRLKGV
jgi:hypothetical protein